jgi:spermidine synthase
MRINNSDSSKFTTNPDKQFIYVQFIEKFIINKLPKDKTHNILVIGAGGFSIGQDDKKNNYTYVDIDKSLLEISEELLMKQKLSDNKDFIPQPARVFLKKDNAKYDVVVLDAYSHILSIPAQLVTYEYFKDVKDRLKEKGTMVANIIAKHNFSDSWSIKVDNTIRSVFGSVNRLPLQKWGPLENKDSNVIYIGFNNAKAKKEIYTDNKNGHFLDR